MPGRYLLDANVIIPLQRTGHLDALVSIGACLDLLLVEEAYDEVTDPRGGKHTTEASSARAVLDANAMIICLDPASAAATRLDALRSRSKKRTKANLGETASIAWAFDQEDKVVLVTRDVAAAFLALDELPKTRVITFFRFLRDAVEADALSTDRARAIAIAATITNGVTATPPLWWDDWLSRR